MGSFNVACGVSRISIGCGMPAGIVPLLPVREGLTTKQGSYIVSNDGIKHSYRPFTLPIFGIYNDYGSLEDIERDINTEAIEKYYQCDIQHLVDYVCHRDSNS